MTNEALADSEVFHITETRLTAYSGMVDGEDLIPSTVVAQFLNLQKRTMDNWCRKRKIPSYRFQLGKQQRYFIAASWLRKHLIVTPDEDGAIIGGPQKRRTPGPKPKRSVRIARFERQKKRKRGAVDATE
jgi:hypothetical protein